MSLSSPFLKKSSALGISALCFGLASSHVEASAIACPKAVSGTRSASHRTLADFDVQIWGVENKSIGTIVLIPGLGASRRTFDQLGPALAERFHVVAYSQAGHGQARAYGRLDFSSHAMAVDLAELLDALDVSSAHILAHSLGARTALKFSELFPDRMRSVIFEDHEFLRRRSSMPDYALTDIEALMAFPTEFASRTGALEALERLAGAASAATRLLNGKTDEHNGRIRLLFQPHAVQLYKTQANDEDLGPALRGLRAPSILILADPSESDMTEEGLAHLRAHRPEMQIERIRGATHSIHWSNPDEFLARARTFLSRFVP